MSGDLTGVPEHVRALLASADALPLRHRMGDATDTARRSAVLVLFGETARGHDVLLIEKSARLRTHAGQPAFPGGGAEPGEDYPVATALREAEEEAGVEPASVRVLGTLPELFLGPSDNLVVPVVGWWDDPRETVTGDPFEVAQVVRVPLADLVDPARRFRVRHPSGYTGPAFEVAGLVVWGFTAGVLDAVLTAAGLARPWDTRDVRDLARRAGAGAGHRRRRRDRGRPRRADRSGGAVVLRSAAYGPWAMTSNRARVLLAVLLLAAGLAGCSNRTPATPEATRTAEAGVGEVTTGADGVQEITLETGDDYVFTPDAFTVAPGPVRLTVTNVAAQLTHNFTFTTGAGPAEITEEIPLLAPGQSETIEFTVADPGDYPFECSFHVALGQVGTMTVTGPPASATATG